MNPRINAIIEMKLYYSNVPIDSVGTKIKVNEPKPINHGSLIDNWQFRDCQVIDDISHNLYL